MSKKQKITYTPHPAIYINSLNEPKLHIFRAFFREPDLPKFKKYDNETVSLMDGAAESANVITSTNMSNGDFEKMSPYFYNRSIAESTKKYNEHENSFFSKLRNMFSKKESIEKTFNNVKEVIEGNIPQNIKEAKEKIDVLIKSLKITGQIDLCKKLEEQSKVLAYELVLIENNYGKYLTEDIVVNVSGGGTREENDTLAKLKSIDTIMYELRDITLSEIPRESEYIEQQEIINNIIDTTKFNVTNFINYITTTCIDELKHNLNFKNQHCRYTQYLDSLIGQTSNIGIFGSKQYLKSTAPLTGVTATADKVLLGRLFYNSSGNATFGNITSIIGRDIDINQTLPTAGKYLTDNINILVSSGGKDTNETLKEIIAMDNLLYNLRFMVNQYITSEEYLQQQEFINNTIYEIQGVEF